MQGRYFGVALVLLSACLSSPPEMGPATTPASSLAHAMAFQSNASVAELGFRLVLDTSAEHRCQLRVEVHGAWQDDWSSGAFGFLSGPGIFQPMGFVFRPFVGAHALNIDTRRAIGSPAVDQGYDARMSVDFGGAFARGPISIVVLAKDVFAEPGRAAVWFSLSCNMGFEVSSLEAANRILLFSMITTSNGTGASISSSLSATQGDSFRYEGEENRTRLIAYHFGGSGKLEWEGGRERKNWDLASRQPMIDFAAPGTSHFVALNWTGQEKGATLAGAIARFAPIGALDALQSTGSPGS